LFSDIAVPFVIGAVGVKLTISFIHLQIEWPLRRRFPPNKAMAGYGMKLLIARVFSIPKKAEVVNKRIPSNNN